MLAASQDRIYLLQNPGKNKWSNISNWVIKELPYDARTGYSTGRGTSAVAAGDFDKDGDIDVVCGSVNNYAFLTYYQQVPGKFLRSEIPIPNPSCTGTVALAATDFKLDGRPDIFGATDRWNAGNEARMWIFKNNGFTPRTITDPTTGQTYTVYDMNWTFRCLNNCQPIIPPSYDVDICTMLDYDKDNDMDLVMADANHSGDYYLIINRRANYYALRGDAVSLNITPNLDPTQYGITKVKITNLRMAVRGSATGLKVTFYVSNDNGLNWELYKTFTGTEIRNYGDELPEHTFDHFGAALKWKAVLEAPNDNIAEYPDGASYDTPEVYSLTLNYTYVDRREYSRSSVATSVIDRSGTNRKLIIASSFVYPGWEGHLRAYDVTGMSPAKNTYSNLRTVSTSDLNSSTGRWVAEGVEILWDAGELLNARTPDSRTIYCGYRVDSDSPLARIDFSTANLNLLSPILQESQGDNTGLINFVRGENRYWKLGDINHSTPVVVGPPEEDPRLMGDGYGEFKNLLINRRKVVYVGANDGMLHCFDVSTGEELWGYIPYNLLSRLKDMYGYDQATGLRFYNRQVYVDGSPTVADVYINNQWRTVLVCGQGAGEGIGPSGLGSTQNHFYYYFALDITDPADPRPLWEFAGEKVRRTGQNYNMTNGQTWSTPFICRVKTSSGPTWVAVLGSGYAHESDVNLYSDVIGNTLAVVKIADGSILKSFRIQDLNSGDKKNSANPFTNIPVALPGSPNGVDVNKDGYVDFVYIGDLDGRIWKLDLTSGKENSWSFNEIYRDKCLYPIITKPAIFMGATIAGTSVPRLYFGTGGDEKAPADRKYSFVALIDDNKTTGIDAVEWFMGDTSETGIPANKKSGELTPGEKVWADPVISDFIVYFSTLKGSIEAADPCQNLSGEAGKLYARYVQPMYGQPIGGSALKDRNGQAIDYLALASKARTAVTVGDRQRVEGTYKRDIYIQEYDSTIERLEQPVGTLLKVRSWREIYQVIR